MELENCKEKALSILKYTTCSFFVVMSQGVGAGATQQGQVYCQQQSKNMLANVIYFIYIHINRFYISLKAGWVKGDLIKND